MRKKSKTIEEELRKSKQVIEDVCVAMLCLGSTWDDVHKFLYPVEVDEGQTRRVDQLVRKKKMEGLEKAIKKENEIKRFDL